MRNITGRLKRLEAHVEPEDQGRNLVLWIGDPLPPDLTGRDRLIFVPHKCHSAEEWQRQCRERWPQFSTQGGSRDAQQT